MSQNVLCATGKLMSNQPIFLLLNHTLYILKSVYQTLALDFLVDHSQTFLTLHHTQQKDLLFLWMYRLFLKVQMNKTFLLQVMGLRTDRQGVSMKNQIQPQMACRSKQFQMTPDRLDLKIFP